MHLTDDPPLDKSRHRGGDQQLVARFLRGESFPRPVATSFMPRESFPGPVALCFTPRESFLRRVAPCFVPREDFPGPVALRFTPREVFPRYVALCFTLGESFGRYVAGFSTSAESPLGSECSGRGCWMPMLGAVGFHRRRMMGRAARRCTWHGFRSLDGHTPWNPAADLFATSTVGLMPSVKRFPTHYIR